MKVLILGDLHGAYGRLHEVITQAHGFFDLGAVIQVGDFGLGPEAALAFKHLTRQYGPLPLPLHILDGNHENHSWVNLNPRWGKAHNLQVHRRGTTLKLGGRNILLCGGALNIDRAQTEEPDPNYVTDGNVMDAFAEVAINRPDVVISHSCPADIGIKMPGLKASWVIPSIHRVITMAGHQTCPEEDPGEMRLKTLWEGLPEKPAQWLFGHFHQLRQTQVGDTTFTCVGSTDGSDGWDQVKPVILNLETLRVNIATEQLGTSLASRHV